MRIASALLSGSVALAVLTAPALAKHSDAQKADEQSTSEPSPCHASERGADGSLIQLPCRELGPGGPARSKSASHQTDHETR
jgi:hypothetical protein